MSVMLGDKSIDYNREFRLFLCSRNPSIRLPTYIQGLVQIINFTVTHSGLEGKLLSMIIDHEQPDIEEQKTTLLKREEDCKVQLSSLEKALLHELAQSEGDILENTALISHLNETKQQSNKIKQSLTESKQLQDNLDNQRNIYRPVASQASTIFILMNDLNTHNPMYRFSLSMFISIFLLSLDVKQ